MTKKFIYRDKIRYSDCDMHQHLNHAKYFSFVEQARVEFFQSMGLNLTSDFKSIPFIIANACCDYLTPGYLGEEVFVVLHVAKIGNSSFTIGFAIKNAKKELLAKGSTVLVMFDFEKMKSFPIPQNLRKKLTAYLQAP